MGRERTRQMESEFKSVQVEEQQQAAQESTTIAAPSHLSERQQAVISMQRTSGNAAVMRALAQRNYGAEGGPIDDQTATQINSARSGGQALDAGTAQKMSSTMGADFSGVKVHTDSTSDTLNRTLNAKAFTTGNDIFFQKGAYNPGTSEGDHLLGHELTHVVQQGGSSPSGSLTLGPANDSYESEAESVASSVDSGVQRAPEDEMEEDK